MAVSAHASLLSLLHLFIHIQHPSLHWLQLDTKRMKNGQQVINFLLDFLKMYDSHRARPQNIEKLLPRAAEIAYEAETTIHSRIVDQLRYGCEDRSVNLPHLCQDLDNAIGKMEWMKNEFLLARVDCAPEEAHSNISVDTTSTSLPPPDRSRMVGFDQHLSRVVNELIGDESGLQMIAVTGMGGIGKTILATNVFEHPTIARRFDRRVWVTVSQEHDVRRILFTLLGDQDNKEKNDLSLSLSELGDRLHKKLFRRRYLIVMDDLWTTEAWEDFRKFFPDNENHSRVMVTTRLSSVAKYIASQDPYLIGFLDRDSCWELFCENAFTREGCPPELEGIGNNIVKSCRGLPLAIVVVGGLLAKSDMSREYWELVANDVNSFASSGDDEHCFNILLLSYNNLPVHLKLCFLYLGRFCEDEEMDVFDVLRIWIDEGFIRPIRARSLEEIAEEYFYDLVSRNMVMIRSRRSTGKSKHFNIHDLLRDLCRRRSEEEHFIIHTPKDHPCFLCGSGSSCEEIVQIRLDLQSSSSVDGTLICQGCESMDPSYPSVRVVKLFHHAFSISWKPTELSDIPMHAAGVFISPSLVDVLWRMQTFIVHYHLDFDIPLEIWELPQLRHLNIGKYNALPDFKHAQVETEELIVLENLHTLIGGWFKFTDETLERIPNLKKLRSFYDSVKLFGFGDEARDETSSKGVKKHSNKEQHKYSYDILGDSYYYSLDNVCCLEKLEELNLEDCRIFSRILPDSLVKLVLRWCPLCPEDMMTIGSLPNLQVLKLDWIKEQEFEWYAVEEGFLQLRYLRIRGDWLVYWEAEAEHYPKLERLYLAETIGLTEIPSGIGDIDTLQSIDVYGNKHSLDNFVKSMVEEQRELGNESIRLWIDLEQVQFEDS